MKFRAKADKIVALNPDILIIPECESPEKLIFSPSLKKPNDFIWFGKNQHKGLGIFCYSDYKIKVEEWHNPDFRMIVPINFKNEKEEFTLFAIWANNPEDKNSQYVGQIWKAINYYKDHIVATETIFVGDFNSNKIWDKKRRIGNHTDVVNFLEERLVLSLYHNYFMQEQGLEAHPTFFMHRNINKPYHIDYCFASKIFKKKLKSVEIGNYKDWIGYSDHMPLIIDF